MKKVTMTLQEYEDMKQEIATLKAQVEEKTVYKFKEPKWHEYIAPVALLLVMAFIFVLILTQ